MASIILLFVVAVAITNSVGVFTVGVSAAAAAAAVIFTCTPIPRYLVQDTKLIDS